LPTFDVNWYDAIVFCNKFSMMMGLTPAYRIPAFNNSADPADWGKIPSKKKDQNIPLWDTVEIVPGSNGYRLPTEAQWEYACRAGTTTAYNTGDTISNNTGWYQEWLGSKNMILHKVGMLPANAWGLYDMHGNVKEWCWDWYDENYYLHSPANNPTGPSSGTYCVIRGGSYQDFHIPKLRSADRSDYYKETRWHTIGIRLVRP